MTTARPYKGAVSVEDAAEQLAREAARGWRRRDLVDAFAGLARARHFAPEELSAVQQRHWNGRLTIG
jgi:HD-GYP domain-containing protein (c-di-GMP phosphodiesterase class II)